MTDELKNFILKNLGLINQNTKESWEKIYEKINYPLENIAKDFTQIILTSGINEPAKILGYIPGHYLYKSNIKNYKIPENVTSIRDWAFYNCESSTSVLIPISVTYIGCRAFSACDSLTSIQIPDSVATIDFGAFASCDNLTSIVIGNGVTSIGTIAFAFCKSLKSVVIPNNLISIGERAFEACDNLKEINFKGTKKEARTKLKVKNISWRKNSAIQKIICTDGVIEL